MSIDSQYKLFSPALDNDHHMVSSVRFIPEEYHLPSHKGMCRLSAHIIGGNVWLRDFRTPCSRSELDWRHLSVGLRLDPINRQKY